MCTSPSRPDSTYLLRTIYSTLLQNDSERARCSERSWPVPGLACAWRALAYECVLTPPTVERVGVYIYLCSAAFTSCTYSAALSPCGALSWPAELDGRVRA